MMSDLPPQVLLPQRLHERPHEQLHRYRERDVYQDDNRRRDVHQHAVKKKIEIHDQSSRGDGAAGGIRSVSSPALLGNKRVDSRCEIDPECLVQLG